MRQRFAAMLLACAGLAAALVGGRGGLAQGGYRSALPLVLIPRPTPTLTPTPTPTPRPAVELLSYSIFRPSGGSSSVYVAGEVQSNASGPVSYVRARFTFRDGAGGIVHSDYALTTIGCLLPGLKSPFQVNLTSFTVPWSTCEAYLSWEPSTCRVHLLEVLEHSAYYAAQVYHVRGRARNTTPETRTYVQAVVTAYDAAGQVVGTGHDYTEPRTLAPGQETLFDIEVRYYAGKPARTIDRYGVLVVED